MLNVILIIIVIYIAMRLMARYLLPWLVKRYMNKFRNQFYQKQGWSDTKDPNLKVNIKHQKEAKSKPQTSEYIDFEEIK